MWRSATSPTRCSTTAITRSLIENAKGGGGNDAITGNAAANLLEGQAGNDTLDGGAGADTLVGADGNDRLIGGSGDNSLDGGIGDDVAVFAGARASYVIALVADHFDVTGPAGHDLVFSVEHFAFADVAVDAAAFSVPRAPVTQREEPLSIIGTAGPDTFDGGNGNDGLWGADGNDVLRGGAGSDGLVGGAGNDLLDGGDGVDFLFGGDFSVVDGSFVPNSGDDTLNGGNGNDGLWGFDGNDVINADAGDDYVEGGLGNNSVSGGADNDTLLGQAGADTIGGGTGFDYLYGGAEADVFVFNKGDSYDTVWDFSAAEGDKVRIDPALAGSFAEFQSRLSGFTFDGADFTVFLSADGLDQLTIKGIAHTAWTADLLA